MTTMELLATFAARKVVTIPTRTNVGTVTGIIMAIEHEDGSGKSYNLTVYNQISAKTIRCYFRTIG